MKKKYLFVVLTIIFAVSVLCLIAGCNLFGSGGNNNTPTTNRVWTLYFVDTDGNLLWLRTTRNTEDSSNIPYALQERMPEHYTYNTITFIDGTPLPETNSELYDYLETHQPDTVYRYNPNNSVKVYTVIVEVVPIVKTFWYYVDDEMYQQYDLTYEQWVDFESPAVPEKDHYSGSWDKKPTEFKNTKITAVYTWLWQIRTYEDWALLNEHNEENFTIENDINFLGNEIPIVTNFKGTLDGQGHTVSNFMNLNSSCAITYGLFATNNGAIKDVTFSDGVFNATSVGSNSNINIGMLVGINNGAIQNVQIRDTVVNITCYHYVSGHNDAVNNSVAGGIIAGKNLGTIEYATVASGVQAQINTYMRSDRSNADESYMRTWASYGMVVGDNGGSISHVTANGTLSSTASRAEYLSTMFGNYFNHVYFPLRLGGVAGANNGGLISDSESGAKLTANHSDSARRSYHGIVDMGGIVGCNNGQIERCVSTDQAVLNTYCNAETRMGGLAGTNDSEGILRASYTTAEFQVNNRSSNEKTYVGGIVGLNIGAVSYCYAIADNLQMGAFENTDAYFGGLFGYANDSGTMTNCFAKVDTTGLINNSECGFYNNATVFRCYAYLSDKTTEFQPATSITTYSTETELIATINKMGFDQMGYDVTVNAYPTLPNVGNNQQ